MNRAAPWEALFVYLDDTCDDDVWHLSVEGVFRVTKSWLYLPLRILWRSLNWLADLEARDGGDTRRVIQMIWWPSSAYAWVVAFRATRRAGLIVWRCHSSPTSLRIRPRAPQPATVGRASRSRRGARARFNREEMPTLLGASYADVRARISVSMGAAGMSATRAQIRISAARTTTRIAGTTSSPSTRGSPDNMKLGHVLIQLRAETKFLHAAHTKCAPVNKC